MVFNVFNSLYLYPCWFNSWQIFFSHALNSLTFYFMSFNCLIFHFVQTVYFWDRILLCSLDWPGAHYLDHTSRKYIKIYSSASWMLGFKGCVPGMYKTFAWWNLIWQSLVLFLELLKSHPEFFCLCLHLERFPVCFFSMLKSWIHLAWSVYWWEMGI